MPIGYKLTARHQLIRSVAADLRNGVIDTSNVRYALADMLVNLCADEEDRNQSWPVRLINPALDLLGFKMQRLEADQAENEAGAL